MIGIRDYSVLPAPDTAMLVRGEPYVDPRFGTRIVKVTDESAGKKCVTAYSWWPTWNADETMMLIGADDVPWIYSFDPATGKAMPLKSLLSVGGAPSRLNWVSAQWDHANPAVLYVIEATPKGGAKKQRIVRMNLARNETTEYRRFSTELPDCELDGLNMSDDGMKFSFMAVAADGSRTACAWDRSAGLPGTFMKFPGKLASPLHSTCISADGETVQVYASYPEPDVVHWHLDDGKLVTLRDGDGKQYGLLQHSCMGTGCMVSGCAADNSVVTRGYDDYFTVRQLFRFLKPDGRDNWSIAYHTSIRRQNGAEQSVVVSTYMGDGNAGTNEIIEVALDGSWFRRLADTRSRGPDFTGDNYWRQPRGNCSPSGRWFAWTADGGTTDRTDVYVLELPPPD